MTDIEQRAEAPDPAYLAAVLCRRQAMQARLDDAKTIFEEVNTEAVHLLTAQYEATRSVKADITLDGETRFATVTRVGGESEAQVTDQGAFQAWVRDTYPDAFDFRVIPARTEIVLDEQFVADLLARATAAGRAVDTTTGEEIPGVRIRGTRRPYFRWLFTRASKRQPLDGRALVAQAVHAGRLDLDTPLALPAAPAADDTATGGDGGECGAREPEPRSGTQACVRPAGHGGNRHRDHWGNEWPTAPAADDATDGGAA